MLAAAIYKRMPTKPNIPAATFKEGITPVVKESLREMMDRAKPMMVPRRQPERGESWRC